jgi:hypothetical protein
MVTKKSVKQQFMGYRYSRIVVGESFFWKGVVGES